MLSNQDLRLSLELGNQMMHKKDKRTQTAQILLGGGGVLANVVNGNVTHIQVWNSLNHEIILLAITAMGTILEL